MISKSNPNPEYPDDGYLYWITDQNQNYSVIDTKTPYTGGDINGNLKPGQKYYFRITAVYTNTRVPGNVIQMTYPGLSKSTMELMDVTPELTLLPGEPDVYGKNQTV